MPELRTLCKVLFSGGAIALVIGCDNPKPTATPAAKGKPIAINVALPLEVKSPEDNPQTEQKVALGKLLFFDPILSGNKDVACATCHHPDNGYSEFLDLSIGVNGQGLGSRRAFREPNNIPLVKRNAQTILNSAFNGIDVTNAYDPQQAPMFWDMRVVSLEKQALEPIKALEEMRGEHIQESEILDEIVQRLSEIPEYQQLFREAFNQPDPINSSNLGKAIAAFERSLVTNNSRFDQFRRGDKDAISMSEQEGFELFKKAGCPDCHNGGMFTDYQSHVLGVPDNAKLKEPDRGVDSTFAFRTPTLRNLKFTAPYMHNGVFLTLRSVLEFYEDITEGKNLNTLVSPKQLDPLVDEIDLEVKDMDPIISFLNTLNDLNFDREVPEKVPSGLPVAGNIQ